MSDEIAEEYARFLEPEAYAVIDPHAIQALSPLLATDLQERWRQRWVEHLSTFDAGMITAAGITVQELVDFRFERLRQRHAGRKPSKRPERVAQRQRAYQAIREADLAGLSWSAAIGQIQAASAAKIGPREIEIDRKTLDAWLRVLHGWGLVRLVPPESRGRGRPRKKGIGAF